MEFGTRDQLKLVGQTDEIQIETSNARTLQQQYYEQCYGQLGMLSMKLQIQKQPYERKDYQLTMISAMSQDSIVANQIVKGGVDSIVFENFIYKMLESVVKDPKNKNRDIVIFMDNAVIHRHS